MAAKLLELVRFRFEKKYIEVSFTKHKLRVLNPKIPAGTVQGCKAGRPEQHREQLLLLKHSLANNSHRNSQKMKMRNSRGSTLRRPQGEAWGGCLTVWLSHTGRADRKQTAVLVGRHQLRSWAVVEPPPKKNRSSGYKIYVPGGQHRIMDTPKKNFKNDGTGPRNLI